MSTRMINVSGTADELNDHLRSVVLPVTVFIAIETVFGFFGNILILLVYFKRYKRINFRYFVLALAIVDLTSCCTTLPGEIFSQLNWYKYEHGWICTVKSCFNIFTVWGSASILLVLAVDRHRKICRPFHWQIRYNVAFRLCVCCILVSSLAAIPMTVLSGTMRYSYIYKGKNVTVSVCEKSGEYANTLYPLIYVWCVHIVPTSVAIIVAMTLNFITARKLFRDRSATASNAKDNSPNTGSSTVMTLKSLDNVRDDEACACKNKVSYKKSHTSKQSHHIKGDASSKTPTGKYLSKTTKVRNDTSDKIITDEEISIGYLSRNKDNPEHESTDKSNKLSTHKFKSYRKSKTLIMLVLTSIFAVTITLYIILIEFVAQPGGILKYMPDAQKAVFFFFWRLYFINSVVNPILYGFMDARFRSGLMSFLPRRYKPSFS